MTDLSGRAFVSAAFAGSTGPWQPARPRRTKKSQLSEDGLIAAMPAIHSEGLFAFALFAPILFVAQLGTFGALIFSMVAVIYAGKRRKTLYRMLRGRWFLLLFPAYALVSVLWSSLPYETLKHSLEFMLTIFAALLIASSTNPRSTLLGIFWAFAIYTTVSLMVGNVVAVGDDGARALSGLNDSKNEEADTAATGLVISISVLVMALRARRPLQCLFAFCAAAVQSYVMVAALSSGALAGAGFAVATLLTLLLLRFFSRAVRAAIVGFLAFVLASVSVLFLVFTSDVLDWLATTFDKDMTLTGRTYLWARARDLVMGHPLLGQGFAAFWQQGNLDAEGLWRFGGITSRVGFNFHNTLYDTLVSLGWIGAAVLGLVFVIGLSKMAAGYVRKPTLLSCFWLSLASYLFVRMPTECIGLNEFYFSTVLLFALLGSAAGPAGAIAVRRPPAAARHPVLARPVAPALP